MLDRPILVFLSGNNASGETSLGQALSERLNWLHLPDKRFDQTYLPDLFSAAERRWSFEAQLHFLSHNVATIQTAIARLRNAFIDRSPYEDAEIFAENFYLRGGMDERAVKTYREAARLFLSSLPQPDLFIYCSAPLSVLEERVRGRGRVYEERYPLGHLKSLQEAYEAWLAGIEQRFPGRVLTVDTSLYDFRTNVEAVRVAADDLMRQLTRLWMSESGRSDGQFALFNSERLPAPPHETIAPCGIRPHLHIIPEATAAGNFSILTPFHSDIGFSANIQRAKRSTKLRAYIAAPFTAKADRMVSRDSRTPTTLPGIDLTVELPHGALDQEYIEWLLELEALVKSAGFSTILPHRDVNKWGRRILEPEIAAKHCADHVLGSDVVVAFPDHSFGVHFEVGIATGAGIPVVVVGPDVNSFSFLMKGVKAIYGMELLTYQTSEELRVKLTNYLSKIEKR